MTCRFVVSVLAAVLGLALVIVAPAAASAEGQIVVTRPDGSPPGKLFTDLTFVPGDTKTENSSSHRRQMRTSRPVFASRPPPHTAHSMIRLRSPSAASAIRYLLPSAKHSMPIPLIGSEH